MSDDILGAKVEECGKMSQVMCNYCLRTWEDEHPDLDCSDIWCGQCKRGRYRCTRQADSTRQGYHFRVADLSDNRVATCYEFVNALIVMKALLGAAPSTEPTSNQASLENQG